MISTAVTANRALSSATPASRTLATSVALALCMAIPMLLSIFFFMGQSVRLDEAQSLWQVSRSVGDIFTIVGSDVHVPFYHVMLHFWLLIFGPTIAAARMLSLIFFVASIPALYLLGSRAYDRSVALFATFIYSISPFMNWYANEARMYTLFALLIILNQYFFIRIYKDEERSDWVWVGYTLTAVFGVFAHYFFFLNLLAQVVFYIVRRDLFARGSLPRFFGAALVVIAAFVPWAWWVFHLGQAGFSEPALTRPTTVDLFSTFAQFLFGFQSDALNTFFLSLWPAIAIIGLLTLGRSTKRMAETEYLLYTILVSFIVSFGISITISPVFVSRYLIFTIPALYLLLANLFSQYSPRYFAIARYSLAGLMLFTLGIQIANPFSPVKENYAQAADFLNAHVTAQDAVILSAPFTLYPVQYYYRGPAPLSTLPVWDQLAHGPIPNFSTSEMPAQVSQIIQSDQNVYLLLSYNQGYEDTIKKYFDAHYQKVFSQTYSSDLTLYEYRLRYDTQNSAMSMAKN